MMQQTNWRERLGERVTYSPDREAEQRRQQELRLRNRRTGINVFQISWIMVFVCLSIVHWQIRTTSPQWPPVGVQKLDLLLPTVATVSLLASGWLMRRAQRAFFTANDLPRFLVQLRLTLALGGAFVGLMAIAWLTVPAVPDEVIRLLSGAVIIAPTTLYNTIFRVMTAFHAVHALAIGAYLFWILRRAMHGTYPTTTGATAAAGDVWDIEAGAKLWYFVVAAWIMFYVVLYWL